MEEPPVTHETHSEPTFEQSLAAAIRKGTDKQRLPLFLPSPPNDEEENNSDVDIDHLFTDNEATHAMDVETLTPQDTEDEAEVIPQEDKARVSAGNERDDSPSSESDDPMDEPVSQNAPRLTKAKGSGLKITVPCIKRPCIKRPRKRRRILSDEENESQDKDSIPGSESDPRRTMTCGLYRSNWEYASFNEFVSVFQQVFW